MARIPIYESQVARPVAKMPMRPYDSPNYFAPVARALGEGADVAEKISLKFQQEEDNRTEMNLRLKAFKDYDAFQTSLEGRTDYQNFEGEYSQFADNWQKENLAGVNDRVYNSVFPVVGEMSIRGASEVRKAARKTQTGISLAELDQSISTAQQQYTFAKDPARREQLIDLTNEMISRRVQDGVLDPLEGQKLWRQQQQHFGDTDVARAMVENPAQLLHDLDDPEKYPWVVGEARYAMQLKIKTKLEGDAKEAQANLKSTVAAQLSDEAAARADGTTTGLSNDRILLAYGNEDGARIIGNMERGAQLNEATKNVANMSPKDELDLLASMKPEGEGYAIESKAYDTLAQAIVNKHKDIADDPSAYVMAHNKAVRDLFAAAASPNAGEDDWQKAIAANLQAQADLGVPTLERKPLSKGDAASWVGTWQSKSDPKQQFDALQGFIGSVSDPVIQRQLFNQLADAGLPSDMRYAIEVAKDPSKRNQAIQLTTELTQKTAPVVTDKNQKSALETQLQKVYARNGIGSVLADQLAITGNAAYASRMKRDQEALEKAAATRMQGGADAQSAVESAYADLFGSKAQAGDTDIGRVTVPAGTDADNLELGMERERERVAQLVTTLIQPLGPNPTPEDQRRVDLWKESYADQLRWINTGEQYGLVDITTGQLVGDPKGNAYVVTLDQLLSGEAMPARPEPVIPELGIATP